MIDGQIAIVVDGDAVLMRQPFAAPDVLRPGGLVGDGIVIRTDGGRASRFAPEVPVSFDPETVRPVFRTFRGAIHRLWVDALCWDWGTSFISAAEVRAIRGIGADGQVRITGADRPMIPTAVIDLTTDPPPRLVTWASSRTHPNTVVRRL